MLTPPDESLVRRDRNLTGLALLLDTGLLAQRLAPHIPELAERPLKCTYLRYKPGTNCLAGYLLESATGPQYLSAQAFRSSDGKLLKRRQRPTADRGDVVPGTDPIVLADEAVVVHLFPADARLESLRTLMAAGRDRLLRKLVPHRAELWDAEATVIRYKPQRRCVVRLDAADGVSASIRCYAAREFEAADDYGFQSAGAMRLPQRLGRSRRHRMLAFEWIPGQRLDTLDPAEHTKAVFQVGTALAELHLQHVHGWRFRTRRREVRELTSTAAAITHLCPDLQDRCERLTRWISIELLSASPMVNPIHGDFYSEQVLLSDDQIVMLDFDEAVFGDPAADLGRFLAHLDRQACTGRLTPDDVDTQAESLLKGYGRRLPVSRERVDLYRAAALLHLAVDPFRSRHPAWSQQIHELVAHAESILPVRTGRQRAINAAASEPAALPGWIRGSLPRRDEVGVPRQSPDTAPTVRRRSPGTTLRCTAASTSVSDPCQITLDPQLAFAVPALDPRQVCRRFRECMPHMWEIWDSASLQSIRVVRHKPGRRCLIEYDFVNAGQDGELLTLIGKVGAKRPALDSYRVQQVLFNNGFGGEAADGIVVPEPLGVVPEWKMWLQRKVRGEPATRLLGSESATELSGWIADAIGKLHARRLRPCRRHTARDEVHILKERLPKVARSQPRWRESLRRILDACERLGKRLPERPRSIIHRDFYPDQVLIDHDRIILLDFDLCCLGDPALDVGNFHAHLTEHGLRHFGRADALAEAQSALVNCYTQAAGEDLRARIDAYSTLSLVRHIYISTLFPDRRHLTEQLMELAASQLNVRLSCSEAASMPASATEPFPL